MNHATIEGNLFSRDFLSRLIATPSPLPHTSPDAYGLGTQKTREAIAQSWNNLAGRFARFHLDFLKLGPNDSATTLTRREWLLPLLQELGFGRVQVAAALGADDKTYPISHGWNQTPIHLLGARVPLDKRSPHVAGASTQAPHALLQEALNRSDAHLWGLVSNGLKLRLLRDSASIARLAYVEFDLQAMFEGDDLASFGALWLLCHASRFENNGAILEAWTQLSKEDGTRALDKLRDGTQLAIETLAGGFLAHANNKTLRADLENNALSKEDFYRYTLRIVYRMLFVLVAESKDALLLPNASDGEKELYRRYFSLSKLKDRALKRRGDDYFDLWRGLKITFGALRGGEAALAMPALGGFLFEPIPFDDCDISNRDLLAALRALGFFEDEKGNRVAVNFNLGSEELGSVYESLLELSPVLDLDARTFGFALLAGNERKTTGAYYTPEILVKSLLESALDPLIDRALGAENPETALLSLSVLDPACGSGHFLTAAARRIAHHLALVRSKGDEPTTPQKRAAIRDVVSHCIYGVDLNPMAVELCKVALWMEALEPGKPLSFLDSHVRQGNALLGATPELLELGVPDDAFKPLEGDDKSVMSGLKKQNKAEFAGQISLFETETDPWENVARGAREIEDAPEEDVEQVNQKARKLVEFEASPDFQSARLHADAWCAAFVWKRVKDLDATRNPPVPNPDYIAPVTNATLRDIRDTGAAQRGGQSAEIERLRALYAWFHPHLEFPLVHERGGFDLVMGNPPWERVKLQGKEWFAARAPEIANASNASQRKALIEALSTKNEALHLEFLDARRRAEGESHFARSSGRFPLCGVGDVNTYALFAEVNRSFIGPRGRVGCIVPSGIATDDTTKAFFAAICDQKQLVSLFDIENKGKKFFPDVHASFKFCLLTLSGASAPVAAAQFVFFAHSDADLSDETKRFALSPADIALLNPNTRTCPIFRSARDAELTKAIYRRVPVLVNEAQGAAGNAWGIRFATMFHMSNDSGLFRTADELKSAGATLSGNVWEYPISGETSAEKPLQGPKQAALPLYEAKMLHHFDHRWATYDEAGDTRDITLAEKDNADFVVTPRYWVDAPHVEKRLAEKSDKGWIMGWRDICRATDSRTLIPSIMPRHAVGDKFLLMFPKVEPKLCACLLASLSSFVCDYASRQKIGSTAMKYFTFRQLPVLPPSTYASSASWTDGAPLREWISSRVVELCYTAHDLAPFARDCGFEGEPFAWDEARRFEVRCQLDAAFFALYGLSSEEAATILDTFPIVRRKDEAKHGEYRTKRRVLELLDTYLSVPHLTG